MAIALMDCIGINNITSSRRCNVYNKLCRLPVKLKPRLWKARREVNEFSDSTNFMEVMIALKGWL